MLVSDRQLNFFIRYSVKDFEVIYFKFEKYFFTTSRVLLIMDGFQNRNFSPDWVVV